MPTCRSEGLALAVAALCGGAPALQAQAAADSAAMVTVAQTLLRAISTKDTALARTVLLPGAVFHAVRDPAPASGATESQTDVEFYRLLATFPGTLLERAWAPEVRMSGTQLGMVTARYDFHVNGKFTHCGTDAFTMLRSGAGWRIAATTYTVQLQGCTPSPLGPPAAR